MAVEVVMVVVVVEMAVEEVASFVLKTLMPGG